jgi:hypothetical protein
MIKRYSEGDIRCLAADYGTHGAVHLPGFLGNEALARLQDVVDAATATIDRPRTADQASSCLRSDGRLAIRYLWRDSADLRQVLLQRAVAQPVARIIGSKTLRFWFDLTFVIDGSHRTNEGYYRSPELKKPAPGEQDGFVDLPDFDALIASGDARMLTWDCQPGDAILLHPCTIHGALGHDGNGKHPRRIAMTTRWLGDDVRFLPHSYDRARQQPAIAQTNLMLGQRPHGEWFPLVYDGSADDVSADR